MIAHANHEEGFAREAGVATETGVATERIRILVVDDDAGARAALAELLQGEGFTTSTAGSAEAALEETRRILPAIVLTDLRMPRMNGTQLCRRLHELDANLPVIMMTAHADMQSVVASLRAGADDYLIKPLLLDSVIWCVQRALARRAAKLERERLLRLLNEQLLLSALREQGRAEAEALQRAQLSALLGNLSEGVAVVEPGGRIVVLNDAARAILGFWGDEHTLGALHLLDARDVEGRQLNPDQRPLMRALAGEQFVDYEIVRVRGDGEHRSVMSTGTCVKDSDGNVVLAIVVFRDITDLRRLESLRDEHLSLVSHDLRNPLNALMMSVALLKRQDAGAGPLTSPGRLSGLERAERSVKRMSSMLEELAETTQLESHGPTLGDQTCELREVVASAVDGMDDTSAHRITIDTDSAVTYAVLGDAARLERVVVNLLTNALKYSGADAPVVVRLKNEGKFAVVEVVDRGIGIGPESRGRLFERYFRTQRGMESAQGLGLGLYISRLIVEAHGGHITVASELDKGSTFSMLMPLCASGETTH